MLSGLGWKKHVLACCGTSHFRILYRGSMLHTWLGHLYVEHDDNAELVAKCTVCGNEIQVVGERRGASAKYNELLCPKCGDNNFAVDEKLEISSDEVSWQNVSLQCNGCRKNFCRFMEIEAD